METGAMEIGGRFRCARRSDHAVPERPPRSLAELASRLDVRMWRRAAGEQPILLATTTRKTGSAVERNRFRRRARMALLAVLKGLSHSEPTPGPIIVWIRPAKGARASEIPYTDIEGQLRLAFSRFRA